MEKATSVPPSWQGGTGHGGVVDPVHVTLHLKRENREVLSIAQWIARCFDNVSIWHDQGTPQAVSLILYVDRKSDELVVPAKLANKDYVPWHVVCGVDGGKELNRREREWLILVQDTMPDSASPCFPFMDTNFVLCFRLEVGAV